MRRALVGSPLPWAPQSRPGTWSLVLATASVAGLVFLAISFATGLVESAAGFTDNWLLTVWGVAILAAGASSVVAGTFAFTRCHERAWAVLGAAVIGLLMTALMLNEVVQGPSA